jgi:hypothetical protein
MKGIIYRRIVINISGTARAYGSLSPSFNRLESEPGRHEAFFLYWDSNRLPWVESTAILTLELKFGKLNSIYIIPISYLNQGSRSFFGKQTL